MGRRFSAKGYAKYRFPSLLFLCIAALSCTRHGLLVGRRKAAQIHMESGGAWSRENLFPPPRWFCVCACSAGVSAQVGIAKKPGGPGWVEFLGLMLVESRAGCGSGAPSSASAKGHFGSSGYHFQALLPKRNVLVH